MRLYDKLDRMILETIKLGRRRFWRIYGRHAVIAAAKEIAEATGKTPVRIFYHRLQALRKRDLIEEYAGWGWHIKEKE